MASAGLSVASPGPLYFPEKLCDIVPAGRRDMAGTDWETRMREWDFAARRRDEVEAMRRAGREHYLATLKGEDRLRAMSLMDHEQMRKQIAAIGGRRALKQFDAL
jgi:hypothetical protein